MRILLDTCAFIWLDSDREKFPTKAQEVLKSVESVTILSMVSVWEIAIKRSLGRLPIRGSIEQSLEEYAVSARLLLLPIRLEHVLSVEKLPFHHRDPFDRLIAVQALSEGLPILSPDASFDAYGVQRIWQ